MRKIMLIIFSAIYLFGFNIFSNNPDKVIVNKQNKEILEKTPKEKTSKEEEKINTVYINKNNTESDQIINSIGLKKSDIKTIDYDKLEKIKSEIPILKKDITEKQTELSNYIKMEQYEKEIKKVFVPENQTFLTLNIPVAQQSTIVFDKVVKEIEYMESNKIKLIWDREKENKILKIQNSNPRIQMNIKIKFYDESILNMLITTGELDSKRYIEYRIFTNTKKVATLKSFQKKIKIENIHDYFNNVSVKLILDYLQQINDYDIIMKNLEIHNKLLNNSSAEISTIYGKENIKYQIMLNSSFPTQFVKDEKDGSVKRLIMLFLNIKNLETDKVFVLNEKFIKKRFSNYTAFYIGNIKNKDNEIAPKQSKNIIVVVEIKEKEGN